MGSGEKTAHGQRDKERERESEREKEKRTHGTNEDTGTRIDHRSNCYKIGVRSRLKSGYGYSAFEFNARHHFDSNPALGY